MRKDGRTGMTSLIVVFRDFANAPKNDTESRRGLTGTSDLHCTSVDRGTLKVMFRMTPVIANVCHCRQTRLVSKMATQNQNS